MIYLSFKNSKEKDNAIDVLKRLNINEDDYFIDKSSNESIKKLKKSNIVICDSSSDMLRVFIALNKKVFVFRNIKNKKTNEDEDLIYFNDKVLKYSQKNELEELVNYEIENRNKICRVITTVACTFVFLLFLTVGITYVFSSMGSPKKDTDSNIDKVDNSNSVSKVDYKYENIVFFGDSITEIYDLEKNYGSLPVINAGTSGHRTTHLLNLVDEKVVRYNPTKVFILIGTNDIAFSDVSNEGLVKNIELIIKKIREKRSKTEIYVESIYPVNRNEDNDIVKIDMVNIRQNDRIQEINKLIEKMCSKNKVTYIDLYSILVDDNGDLNLNYTYDGLHLKENGYEFITKTLIKYIDSDNK